MLQVAPVKRETIDLWPVAESGSAGARGQQRGGGRRVTRSGSCGRGPIRISSRFAASDASPWVTSARFFKLCGQIEQGKQSFQNIQEVFAIFLDGAELKVLAARYGFDREDLRGVAASARRSRRSATRSTRPASASARSRKPPSRKLSSRLATVCLQPFYELFVSFLDSARRDGRPAPTWRPDPERIALLAGYNVCGVLLLLSDLDARPDHVLPRLLQHPAGDRPLRALNRRPSPSWTGKPGLCSLDDHPEEHLRILPAIAPPRREAGSVIVRDGPLPRRAAATWTTATSSTPAAPRRSWSKS